MIGVYGLLFGKTVLYVNAKYMYLLMVYFTLSSQKTTSAEVESTNFRIYLYGWKVCGLQI